MSARVRSFLIYHEWISGKLAVKTCFAWCRKDRGQARLKSETEVARTLQYTQNVSSRYTYLIVNTRHSDLMVWNPARSVMGQAQGWESASLLPEYPRGPLATLCDHGRQR